MANATAFRRGLQIFRDANLAPDAVSARLAASARAEAARLLAESRVSLTKTTTVDGRRGASEDSVRGTGGGVIIYEWSYTADAAVFALDFLKAATRTMQGYSRSFFVSVDGRFIKASDFSPSKVPADAEIIIGNTQPYNRIVDVQRAGNTVIRFKVPADLYALAGRAALRRFGNACDARRVYTISFPGQYVLRRNQVRKTAQIRSKVGSTVRRAGERVQSPALVITARR